MHSGCGSEGLRCAPCGCLFPPGWAEKRREARARTNVVLLAAAARCASVILLLLVSRGSGVKPVDAALLIGHACVFGVVRETTA